MKVWPIDPLVPRNFEARGARKVTTGIRCSPKHLCDGPRRCHQRRLVSPRLSANREWVVRPSRAGVWMYGNTTGCGKLSPGDGYQARGLRAPCASAMVAEGNNPVDRDNPQHDDSPSGGQDRCSTLGKLWVPDVGLKVRATPHREVEPT